MIDLAEAEKVAVEAARKAGAVLLKYYRKDLNVKIKGNNLKDVVTNADIEADKVVRDMLLEKFPETGIVSEESEAKEGEYTWYIDPLDGTTNYSEGLDFFCTSIALGKGDDIILGVIYAPLKKELYTAVKGKGAFCNGKRIYVSRLNDPAQVVIDLDFGYKMEGREKTLKIISQVMSSRAVRLCGSGALTCAMIAEGIKKAYIHFGTKPWDYSASTLLIREAGGKVTDIEGNPWNVDSKSGIIASKGILHDYLLEKVRKALE